MCNTVSYIHIESHKSQIISKHRGTQRELKIITYFMRRPMCCCFFIFSFFFFFFSIRCFCFFFTHRFCSRIESMCPSNIRTNAIFTIYCVAINSIRNSLANAKRCAIRCVHRAQLVKRKLTQHTLTVYDDDDVSALSCTHTHERARALVHPIYCTSGK